MTLQHADTQGSAADRLESHRPFLTRTVERRVRSRQDAEDIVQTVFMRAAANLESFRGDCPLSQWLLRIALNELKLYYARRLPKRANQVSIDELSEQLHPRGEHDPTAGSTAERLFAAARLACSEDEQRVLMLVYRGTPFDQAASILGMPAATARSHFLRGRSSLLAHVFANEPDLLGGREAIEEGYRKAREVDDESCRLTAEEEESWVDRSRRMRHFRSACLKVARFLPIPALLAFIMGEVR